jgi:hypothetical protein
MNCDTPLDAILAAPRELMWFLEMSDTAFMAASKASISSIPPLSTQEIVS